MIRTLKSLSVVSTIGMLFILIGGALVTKTDSGAGCGDSWPLCHGQILPTNITPELVIELSHRLVSTVIGVTLLLLGVLVWRYISNIRVTIFLSINYIFYLVLHTYILNA